MRQLCSRRQLAHQPVGQRSMHFVWDRMTTLEISRSQRLTLPDPSQTHVSSLPNAFLPNHTAASWRVVCRPHHMACRARRKLCAKRTGQMDPSGLSVGTAAKVLLRTGFSQQTRRSSVQSFHLHRRCHLRRSQSRWRCFRRSHIEQSGTDSTYCSGWDMPSG
jgi:hypothetical protein